MRAIFDRYEFKLAAEVVFAAIVGGVVVAAQLLQAADVSAVLADPQTWLTGFAGSIARAAGVAAITALRNVFFRLFTSS